MNATTKLSNNFQLSFRGFFFACHYLMENRVITEEELKAYAKFPHGRRENFVAIIQRANKIRNEAHRKAMAISELQ